MKNILIVLTFGLFSLVQAQVQTNTSENYSFASLNENEALTFFFSLEETKNLEMSSSSKGEGILIYKNVSLADLYKKEWAQNNVVFVLNDENKNQRFDLVYKNSVKENNSTFLSELENEILKQLNLIKQIGTVEVNTKFVQISNPVLLTATEQIEFNSISSNDNKELKASGYSVEQLLELINNTSDQQFKLITENDKKYDFVIDITSEENIIKSLESYGLSFRDGVRSENLVVFKSN